jgi:hypothetical protein
MEQGNGRNLQPTNGQQPGVSHAKPMLPAKGFCWYCDHAVDNVRRFCSVTCREDYYEEEAEFGSKSISLE